MKKIILFSFFISITPALFSQDDLMNMLDTMKPDVAEKQPDVLIGMFKTLKVISLQTPQTMGHGELDFRITHRFGNMGTASNGGAHTMWGFDVADDIRYSLDYGLTENFQIGIGRSKKMELIDGSLKWRFLEQTLDNKVPLSICAYTCAALTPMRTLQLYSGADTGWVNANEKFAHKLNYFSQLIFARQFTPWLSVAVAPSYSHRNYVLGTLNNSNGTLDENDLFSVGAGIRLKVSRSVSILADYFYTLSDFRQGNSTTSYYHPLAIGVEIETGGHVFHINLTNASGIIENYFIPNTTDSWAEGGYKFGFNISRAFTIVNK